MILWVFGPVKGSLFAKSIEVRETIPSVKKGPT